MKIGLWFMMTGISFIVLSRNPFDRRDKCLRCNRFHEVHTAHAQAHITGQTVTKSKSACRFFNRILLRCLSFFSLLRFTPIYLHCECLTLVLFANSIRCFLSAMRFSFARIWCSYTAYRCRFMWMRNLRKILSENINGHLWDQY